MQRFVKRTVLVFYTLSYSCSSLCFYTFFSDKLSAFPSSINAYFDTFFIFLRKPFSKSKKLL